MRPLALQEPVGKTVASVLNQIMMNEAAHILCQYPQFAFMKGRSAQECIRKVLAHCQHVADLRARNCNSVASRAKGFKPSVIGGGLQLCVDLERAFDKMHRPALFQRMSQVGISSTIISIVLEWRRDTEYHIIHRDLESQVPTTTGLRQGCTLAPGLWAIYTVLIMLDLQTHYSLEELCDWLTVYADDFHAGRVISSPQTFLDSLLFFGRLLDALTHLGMSVNTTKSKVLIRLQGSKHRQILSQHTYRNAVGHWLMLPSHTGATHDIPIASDVSYLGIVISYHNATTRALTHRLKMARVAFARLSLWLMNRHLPSALRLRFWYTCVWPVMCYGLAAADITDQGLR